MKRFRLALLLALLPSVAVAQAPKSARINFDDHVLPIMKDKCASCHNPDKKRAGLIVTNYTKIMEGGSSGVSVKPGDPDGSLLYKLMAHVQEPYMPPNSPKLPKDTLEVVHKWIAGGAPENSGSKVVIPDRPRVDFTLPSVAKGKPAVPPMPPTTLRLDPVVKVARNTAVTAMAANPWSPLLAVGGQKQVLLFHTDTLDLLGVLPFPEGTPNVLSFSRNGSLLLAGGGRAGKSGRVVVWSVAKGERLLEVGEETDCVLAADISPDQSHVALGGPSKVVRIFNTKERKLVHEIRKHTDWVTSLSFSPDGVLLASGDRNGGLFVWEAFTAREYHTLKGHTASITDISWRPDSNVVGSASEDATVRLFEMENGNQVRGWGANPGGALSLSYSSDGQILSAGRDRLVRLWDGNGGAKRNFDAFPDVALKAVFTHDAKRVIASDWEGTIAVWNMADGKKVGTLTANPLGATESLALAQKTLAEKQKLSDQLAAVAKTSMDALNKTNADLAAATKAITDTANALKAAEGKFASTNATVTNARLALKNAEAEARAKAVLATALTEASAKVKTEADKAKDNAALQIASARALALATQAVTESALAEKTQGDLAAAVRTVEPEFVKAQQTLTAAQAAATSAPKTVAALQAAQKTWQAKAPQDKATADAVAAELAQVRATVARWESAVASTKKPAK